MEHTNFMVEAIARINSGRDAHTNYCEIVHWIPALLRVMSDSFLGVFKLRKTDHRRISHWSYMGAS
jgi:hypothetical protein